MNYTELVMSDKKPTNIPNAKPVDEDQSHSDSDDSSEKKPKTLLKLEKKKPMIPNFGRPRKHPYKPGKYKCIYCDTMCSKPSVLTKHLRAHTNERPFPCGLCKRSFKTKSNLSKHEKSKSHSSKLEENSAVHNKQSKRETAEILLQALSGMESIYPRNVESMTNIEFDSNERKTSVVESNCSSPALSEDKSIISEENCVHENVKKEKHVDHASSFSEDIPGKVENASSCSGVLTINSQAGPITVEVQINLETMRQLQQGLSNITNKKHSPLSPVPLPMPRNDAELRAAESILHMANQWTHIPETFNSKDDFRKNGATARKLPDTLSPLHRKSPDIMNFGKLNVTKPLSSKDSNSNKSTPLEESDMMNFKNQTKCLVKENLLKKMKRKQVQENNNSSTTDPSVINGSVVMNHNIYSSSKTISDKVTESVLSPSISRASHLKFNQSQIRSESMLKNLIADSKSTTVFSIKSNKRGSGIIPNSQILNNFTIPSQSPTIVVLTPTSSLTKTLLSDSKSLSDMTSVSNSESKNNGIFDIDTATLSKVITNTQSLHQHQASTVSNVDILSVTNSITTSRVATISSSCIESDSKENISVENVNKLVIDEQPIEDDKYEKQPFTKKPSIQTSQEFENELSPRLCIVEESSNTETYLFDKKLTESDEEIDVVNTDSDDERLSLQRIPQVNNNYSESASKRRKLTCDDDSEMIQSDSKRTKEVEKCVPLHAPNINAKDLMQDCPLNLSANRQPTILPVPPIPVSVLQNLYQNISPSSCSASSSINSTNAQETISSISVLTNHNPAHPQSFQNFQSTTSLSTNGHHRDYPIFEDKIGCEECGTLIEPSMMTLHNNMHIYTSGKDSHLHGGNNNTKSGSSIAPVNNNSSTSSSSKIPFNRPRLYKCVVCNIAFRVIGHLRKHHKSKSHLQGLVNSGLLSKTLFSKIEQSKVPIQEVIDQKTGNIIPDVLSRYISNWSQANTESDSQH